MWLLRSFKYIFYVIKLCQSIYSVYYINRWKHTGDASHKRNTRRNIVTANNRNSIVRISCRTAVKFADGNLNPGKNIKVGTKHQVSNTHPRVWSMRIRCRRLLGSAGKRRLQQSNNSVVLFKFAFEFICITFYESKTGNLVKGTGQENITYLRQSLVKLALNWFSYVYHSLFTLQYGVEEMSTEIILPTWYQLLRVITHIFGTLCDTVKHSYASCVDSFFI
jgi:hypothetical protein